ncbi:MAG: adenine phosphoribosyltransferase [Coriobacteriia bacterium]|nr:adenine phosphoribosyltransferase [Coriobacteriia bacterium]
MATNLEDLIVNIPDFPKPGIIFRDITPVFGSADGLKAMTDLLAQKYADRGITKIVGAESRGFMVGAPLAYAMGVGFVPARKPGKLPRAVLRETYELEYGTDELQIHTDALTADDVVLLIDDLLATGGTAAAQARLVQQTGAKIAGVAFLMELTDLGGRAKLEEVTDAEIYSILQATEE